MYFLNINKPKGISSFDVIRILRKKLSKKSIGHSGTLDPLASGVMQIGVDGCTKLLDYLSSDKKYIAKIKFGFVSDTFDEEGEKIFVSKPAFSQSDLAEALNSFIGKSIQIPPKYSAIKYKGAKLCDLARKGIDIVPDFASREIEVYSVNLINCTTDTAEIDVHVKKGTYIRSLVNDLGKKLGCGAYVTDLIRVKAGNFDISDSEDINSDHFKEINPLDVIELDKYELSESEFTRIKNGNNINTTATFKTNNILLTKNNKLVSIGYLSDNQNNGLLNIIKPRKNFNEG